MTQLIVSLDDKTLLPGVKSAIRMLRGVTSVKVCPEERTPNATTLKAMHEVENGDTIVCDTMSDYLKLVGYGVQEQGLS